MSYTSFSRLPYTNNLYSSLTLRYLDLINGSSAAKELSTSSGNDEGSTKVVNKKTIGITLFGLGRAGKR